MEMEPNKRQLEINPKKIFFDESPILTEVGMKGQAIFLRMNLLATSPNMRQTLRDELSKEIFETKKEVYEALGLPEEIPLDEFVIQLRNMMVERAPYINSKRGTNGSKPTG